MLGIVALVVGGRTALRPDQILRLGSVAVVVGLAVGAPPREWRGRFVMVPLGIWAIVSAVPTRTLEDAHAGIPSLPRWPDAALVLGALGLGLALGQVARAAWVARRPRPPVPESGAPSDSHAAS